MRIGICIILATLSLTQGMAAQRSTQGEARVGPVPGLDVRRTDAGDYEISYDALGARKSFVFVPATKVDPLINVTVTPTPSGFAYAYTVTNGRPAKQDLHAITMKVAKLVKSSSRGPDGWETMETPQTQRLSWYKIPASASATVDGIPPGLTVGGFGLESPLLPGPDEISVEGAVASNGFPSDLSVEIQARLNQTLVLRNYVMAWTLTPSLANGFNEPELTPAVFVARVRAAYMRALQTSRHPKRSEVGAALDEAVELLGRDARRGGEALNRAKGLALDSGSDSWARSLGAGLATCLDFGKQLFKL